MIRIRVEMLPGGNEEGAYLLGEGFIINDGTSPDRTIGNYTARFGLKRKREWRLASIPSFKREQYNVWYLLLGALAMALGPEAKKAFK